MRYHKRRRRHRADFGSFTSRGLATQTTRNELSEWPVGTTIHLDLEEMGASGPARVVNIGRAPAFAQGSGPDRVTVKCWV